MNHTQMSEMMERIMNKVNTMRDAGQKEYAHDTKDVFANFNRISDLLQTDRKKVLMTYMLKHVDGIAAYVKGHKSQRENVTGRITDCIVYLMLLWGMIEEEDGTFDKEHNDEAMLDVLKDAARVSKQEMEQLSVDNGLLPSGGIYSESDLQKVRETGDWLEKSEEVGTT